MRELSMEPTTEREDTGTRVRRFGSTRFESHSDRPNLRSTWLLAEGCAGVAGSTEVTDCGMKRERVGDEIG